MTRQEILSWADEAWATSTEREGESLVVRLVRATLEEAARAACVGCDSTDKLFNDGVAWMHRDESPSYDGPYYRCMATKIHDLIAALDSEDV